VALVTKAEKRLWADTDQAPKLTVTVMTSL
jgi:hypothetical protein